MAKPGRRPNPSRLRVLPSGNAAPSKTIKEAQPKAKPKRPTKPGWLTGEARKEWNRAIKALDRLGLLDQADRAILVSYCVLWARLDKIEQRLAELPVDQYTGETEKGYEYPVPLIVLASKLAREIRMLANELGFTPSARTRLPIAEPKDRDEYEQHRRRRQA